MVLSIAASMRVLMLLVAVSSLRCAAASASPPVCPRQSKPLIIDAVRSQCPLSFSNNSPREVDGDSFERSITSKRENAYTSVLFYASWCPFSYHARSNVEVLSALFPQIEHLAVEHSSAMPSLLSQYGIHSLPAILIVNETSRLRYHGPKDLASLALFYKRTTGYEPIPHVTYQKNEPYSYIPADHLESRRKFIMQSYIGLSAREMLKREPCVVFAVFFLCLRLAVYAFPRLLRHFRGIWVSHAPHLNLQIFGETSQIMGRVLHMMDVKRVWTKLRLCKSRNFHQGARNARVWACL